MARPSTRRSNRSPIPPEPPPRAAGDHGQVVPFAALLLVVLALGVLVLGRLGADVDQAARVRTAADAAALAGAAEGRAAATEVAEANGAELVGWRSTPDGVVVTVVIGDARATAAAAVVVGRRH